MFLVIKQHISSWLYQLHASLQTYWYQISSSTPIGSWKFLRFYLGLLGIFLVIVISTPFLPIRTEGKSKLLQLGWSNLVIGAILSFLRYQQIPILGMDIWRTIQEIGIIIWITYLLIYFRTDYR